MNKKTVTILYVALIIFIIIFMGYCIYFLNSIGGECVKQPFQYGINDLEGRISCECVREYGMSKTYFGFNSTIQWNSKSPYDPRGEVIWGFEE